MPSLSLSTPWHRKSRTERAKDAAEHAGSAAMSFVKDHPRAAAASGAVAAVPAAVAAARRFSRDTHDDAPAPSTTGVNSVPQAPAASIA
jgi:hypothetical protein